MPGLVANFSVDEVDAMTVSVEWQSPREPNGIILGYEIFYRVTGATENLSIPISVSDLMSMNTFQRNITGLMAFTDYEVRMRARTSVGFGLYTSFQTVRTDPDSASAPTLTAMALNSTSIMLKWNYPSMPRGSIIGYLINSNASASNVSTGVRAGVSVSSDGDGIEVNITLEPVNDMTDQKFVFASLTPSVFYSFTVRAYSFQFEDDNSPFVQHLGEPSNTVIVQTNQGSKSEMLSKFVLIKNHDLIFSQFPLLR